MPKWLWAAFAAMICWGGSVLPATAMTPAQITSLHKVLGCEFRGQDCYIVENLGGKAGQFHEAGKLVVQLMNDGSIRRVAVIKVCDSYCPFFLDWLANQYPDRVCVSPDVEFFFHWLYDPNTKTWARMKFKNQALQQWADERESVMQIHTSDEARRLTRGQKLTPFMTGAEAIALGIWRSCEKGLALQ